MAPALLLIKRQMLANENDCVKEEADKVDGADESRHRDHSTHARRLHMIFSERSLVLIQREQVP